ncbi:hypothetical protein M758_UG182500 [Ceratodon purpureus]|nr:hypothetical protein M758_UG182500 [Ceratodon purpureus]
MLEWIVLTTLYVVYVCCECRKRYRFVIQFLEDHGQRSTQRLENFIWRKTQVRVHVCGHGRRFFRLVFYM